MNAGEALLNASERGRAKALLGIPGDYILPMRRQLMHLIIIMPKNPSIFLLNLCCMDKTLHRFYLSRITNTG
jgi:hypothetical protein